MLLFVTVLLVFFLFFFFSLSWLFQILFIIFFFIIPDNKLNSSATLSWGTLDFIGSWQGFIFSNWNVKSFYMMFLTLTQCLCFKIEIPYFYKGFCTSTLVQHSSNFKIKTSFIQSYHNLKKPILKTEKEIISV